MSTDNMRWVLGRVIVLLIYLLLPSSRSFPTDGIRSRSLYKLVVIRNFIAKQALGLPRRLQKLSPHHYDTLITYVFGLAWWEFRSWSDWWGARNPLNFLDSESLAASSSQVRPFHRALRERKLKPDPALVFDTLLARGVAVRDNPSQISRLFLHFAALVSIDRSKSVRYNSHGHSTLGYNSQH